MTATEFKETQEYAEMLNRIAQYHKGFEFTLHYAQIPQTKANALRLIIEASIKNGTIESIAVGLDIDGNMVEETYRRI